MGRTKHIPQRTCVICGKKTDKRDLLRLVYQEEGGLQIDPSGKMEGRGAYLCKEGDCLAKTKWKEVCGKLNRALRTTLSDADQTRLRGHFHHLITS